MKKITLTLALCGLAALLTSCGGSYRKAAEGVTVVSKDVAPVTRVYDDVGFRVVKFALSQRDAK